MGRHQIRCLTTAGLLVALALLASGTGLAQAGGGDRIAELNQSLLGDPDAPVIGNPHGRDAIVEFFDYRCPYCRALGPVLRRLLAEDGEARVTLEEWPNLGAVSTYAARVALAARWQGRFRQVHDGLLDSRGPLDKLRVREIAEDAGVDLTRLDRDMAERGAELDGALRQVAAQAEMLHLQGTPGLVIGRRVIFGALSLEDLESLLAQERGSSAGSVRDVR